MYELLWKLIFIYILLFLIIIDLFLLLISAPQEQSRLIIIKSLAYFIFVFFALSMRIFCLSFIRRYQHIVLFVKYIFLISIYTEFQLLFSLALSTVMANFVFSQVQIFLHLLITLNSKNIIFTISTNVIFALYTSIRFSIVFPYDIRLTITYGINTLIFSFMFHYLKNKQIQTRTSTQTHYINTEVPEINVIPKDSIPLNDIFNDQETYTGRTILPQGLLRVSSSRSRKDSVNQQLSNEISQKIEKVSSPIILQQIQSEEKSPPSQNRQLIQQGQIQQNQTYSDVTSIKQFIQNLKSNESCCNKIEVSLALMNNSLEKVLIVDEKKEIKFIIGNLKIDIAENIKLSEQYLLSGLQNFLQNKQIQYWPLLTTKSKDFPEFVDSLKENKPPNKIQKKSTIEMNLTKHRFSCPIIMTNMNIKNQTKKQTSLESKFQEQEFNDQDRIGLLKLLSMTTNEPQEEIQIFTLLFTQLNVEQIIDSIYKYALSKQGSSNNIKIMDFMILFYILNDMNQIIETRIIPLNLNGKIFLQINLRDMTDFQSILLNDSLNKTELQTQLCQINSNFRPELNCVLTMLDIISHFLQQTQIETYLEPAISSSKLLMSQLNDLQDFIFFKQFRHLKLIHNDFDIRVMIKDCIDIIKCQALFKNIDLEIKIRQETPIYVRSDANRFKQIILNLLTQQIKLIMNGTIEIIVEKSLDHEKKLLIKISSFSTQQFITKNFDYVYYTMRKINNQFYNDQWILHTLLIADQLIRYLDEQHQGLQFYHNIDKNQVISQFSFQLWDRQNRRDSFKMLPNFNRNICVRERISSKQLNRFNSKESTPQLTIPERKTSITSHMISPLIYQINVKSAISELDEAQANSSSENIEDQLKNLSVGSENVKMNSALEALENEEFSKPKFIEQSEAKNIKDNEFIISSLDQKDIIKYINSQPYSFGQVQSADIFGSQIFQNDKTTQQNTIQSLLEKADKLRNRGKQLCNCDTVLILEEYECDSFSLTMQMNHLNIRSKCLYIKEQILQMLEKQECCRVQILFYGMNEIMDIDQITILEEVKQKDIVLIGVANNFSLLDQNKYQFQDYLIKPILLDCLIIMLAKWLK